MSEQQEQQDKCGRKRGGGGGGTGAAAGGTIWFIGWLFTISFAQLVWWKIILGLILWPYFLGQALR